MLAHTKLRKLGEWRTEGTAMIAAIDREGAELRETVEVERPRLTGAWVLEIGTPDGGHARLLQSGDSVVLGSGQGADIRLEDPAVSQRHCRLEVTADHVSVEDLRSKNGVYVGAVRVGTASVLESGVFVIGRTTVVVRAGGEEPPPNAEPVPGLVGSSFGIKRVAAEVRRHARTRAPVLLQGESGTGKDVVARAIHQLSGRTGAYVPLNVGALPESLSDAELFGHKRGAFTGAQHNRAGAFEQAHGGTLFLDEIADLPLGIQVKLLRVVEDGQVRALGASQATRVDVRVVSASWAVIEQRVERAEFRADLFHRLSTVVVQLPPLRQRRSDIAELSAALLRRIRDEVGVKSLTSAALSRLVDYDWPGNVRELGSVLYRAAMASPNSDIRAEHVRLPERAQSAPARIATLGPGDAGTLLRSNAGNVSAAARAAGVPRSTFRAWLAKAVPRDPEDDSGASSRSA